MIVNKGDKILISWDNFKYLFILYQIAKLLNIYVKETPFYVFNLTRFFIVVSLYSKEIWIKILTFVSSIMVEE